ncbi:MAG: YedE family putative selenium transporter [Candidatus Pelethousia sp.]|nr:YedE family putative selenium transporter [Candidatus Pelethousia sp.]
MSFFKKHGLVVGTGLVVGAIAVALVAFGNPKNMGFCIACFLRDIAGGVGMHRAEVVQYVRPEIIGLVLGALVMSLIGKEFAPKGGSAPLTRFALGFAVMVGALMFLGCPLRMMIRIGGGDLNAVVGLIGFVAGILIGIFFLNKGFSLKRTYDLPKLEGYMPGLTAIGLLLLLTLGAGLLFFSESGPGSMRAPVAIALIAGLVVGALAQKSRLCTVGGIRDAVMFKDLHLLYGFIAIILTVLLGNLLTGTGVKFSFAGQPVAHTDGLWNALGMVLVGFGSVLLGGCPLRQLILAGSGNADSGVAVLGMVVGAAFCHNFKLASSADGPTANGQIAVILCLALVALIAVLNLQKQKD